MREYIAGLQSEFDVAESLIKSKDVPVYPFKMHRMKQQHV